MTDNAAAERIDAYLREVDEKAALAGDLYRDWLGDECPLCGTWLRDGKDNRLVCQVCDVFYNDRDERDFVAAQLATFYPEE